MLWCEKDEEKDYMYLTFDLWMSYQILQHSCVLLGHLGRATLFFSPSLSFSLFLSLCGIVLWKHAGTAGLIHRERSWSKVNEKSTTLSLSLPVFSALPSFIRPISLCCINLVFIFYLVLLPRSVFFYFTSMLAFKFNVSDVLWSLPCAWYPKRSSLMTQFLLLMPQRCCFD